MNALDPESRRVLAQARLARTPSAVDKARVERRIAAALSGAAALATAQAASASPGGSGGATATTAFTLKTWLVGSVLFGAVLGALAVAIPALREPAPAAQRAETSESRPAHPKDTPLADAPPRAVQSDFPTRAAPREAEAREAQSQAPTLPAARSDKHGGARHRDTRGGAETLAAELELLHDAQAAWRNADATRALALVETHQRRYAASQLKLERDTLRVLILCDLGRAAEARKLARGLLARARQQPLAASLEKSCAQPGID